MRPWMKKTLKWSGISLVALAALYAGLIAYSFHVADQAVARWRAAGFPTTLDELAPPVPDEQNAAVVLHHLSIALGEAPDHVGNYVQCLRIEHINDAKCQNIISQHHKKIDAWRIENAPKLAMIDEALLMPSYYIPLYGSTKTNYAPFSIVIDSPIYNLSVDDYYNDIKANNSKDATDKILRILKLFSLDEIHAIAPEIYYISIILRNNVLRDIGDFCSQELLPREHALSLKAQINKIDLVTNYRHAVEKSLAVGDPLEDAMLLIAADPRSDSRPYFERYLKKAIFHTILGRYLVRINFNRANKINTLLDLYDLAGSPEDKLADTARIVENQMKRDKTSYWRPDIPIELANEALVAMTISLAKLNITKVRLALLLHKLTHGAYPATLDALDPSILSPVPHDIFAKQPFAYALAANGTYTLSSPGLDALPFRSEYEYPRFQ